MRAWTSRGSGTVGIITYLRTDSTGISEEAQSWQPAVTSPSVTGSVCCAGEYAKRHGKKIQDAHEAIRPTDISRTPEQIKDSLSLISTVCIS